MRQKLITIESDELYKYNIPQLYFDEKIIVIVYNDFSNVFYRYVHTPRIFLLPRELYESVMSSTYTFTETKIKFNNHVIDNTNATVDGNPYFPKDEIQLDVQEEYIKLFRKHIPERQVQGSTKNLEQGIKQLQSIKVPTLDFSNLDIRIQRLFDFGEEKLADKLIQYYKKHKDAFIDASSLSIQFNDLNDVSFDPLQSSRPTLYYKLKFSTGVYSWYGYSTFIDTLTRVLFYTSVIDHAKLFAEYFSSHKPVFVVFGILNYHLAQNIHEKTNRNDKFYNILLKELG